MKFSFNFFFVLTTTVASKCLTSSCYEHHHFISLPSIHQNINKLAEVKVTADIRETEKCMERRHIFDNKLYAAEQKREETVRKKLEKLREHVGV